MSITITQLRTWLLGLFLFLLPWQTRWIFRPAEIGGAHWEYGTIGIYATELLFLIIILLDVKKLIIQFARIVHWRWVGGAFLAFVFLSMAWSASPLVTFFATLHLLEAALLIFILASLPSGSFGMFASAFVLGAVVQAGLGLAQIALQWVHPSTVLGIALHDPIVAGTAVVETVGGRFLRAYGGLPHPNILGGYLTVAVLVLISLIREVRNRTLWVILLLGAAILLGALFLTFSRSAWIALGVGVVAAAVTMYLRSRVEFHDPVVRWRIGSLALLAVCILAVFGFAFRDVVIARWSGAGRLETISREERLHGVRDAWELVRARPIVGWGAGMFTRVLADQTPGKPAWTYQPVHSVPLLVLAELGAVGIIVLLVALFGLWRLLVRWWYIGSRDSRIRSAALAGAVLGMLTIAIFDHYLWSLYAGNMLAGVTLGFLLNQAQKTP